MSKPKPMPLTEIRGFKGAHRFLSNFWWAPVEYEGVTFSSVEHAYQAAKCIHPKHFEGIRKARTPREAKRLGKFINVRPDWNKVRLDIMEQLVRDKFQRNEALAKLLVATHPMRLVEENSWGDKFWGECNGEGENHLGKILMKVREELRNGG